MTSDLYTINKLSDLLWNQEEAKQVLECVKNKQPVIIHGPPGVGKSSSVHAIGNELNMQIYEINGSEDRTKAKLDELIVRASHRSLLPYIIFIDEADSISAWSTVEKLLILNPKPIVMAANEIWRIPSFIKTRCKQIKYREPTTFAIVQLVKRVSNNAQFDRISGSYNDFRANLLSAIYGGSKHERSDIFKDTENLIRKGVIPTTRDKDILLYLLDNSHKFFYGRKLYEYIQFLCMIDLIADRGIVDKWNLLTLFTSDKQSTISYPYFLKRASVLSKVNTNGG